jgi:hypothetical protein
MKHFLCLAIFTIFVTGLYAQHTEDGYYITRFNDSVVARIRVPRDVIGRVQLSKLHHKVEIVDSTDSTTTFSPAELKSFGFTVGETVYTFVAKPIKEGYDNFLQPLVVGQSTSLYKYIESVPEPARQSALTGQPVYSAPSVHEYYTLEKPGGMYLFVSSDDRLDDVKEQIKLFYQKNSFAQLVIDKKFKAYRKLEKDITEVVETVNKYSWVN